MTEQDFKYANKILYFKPQGKTQRSLLREALHISKVGFTEEGHFSFPNLDEALEHLVSNKLLSKNTEDGELDFLDKHTYSITTQGYELVNNKITFVEFLKNKEKNDKEARVSQERKQQQQILLIALPIIAIIISILAIIFS